MIKKYRRELEDFIRLHNEFSVSLKPLAYKDEAIPKIIADMLDRTAEVGVGPMAAVAGAMAEFVGRDLMIESEEIIVENGGDIFIQSAKKRNIGLFSGSDSPFSHNLGLEIESNDTPLGICTSSGTIGHSLSKGKADAVVVVSPSTALADAAATMIGNHILDAGDIPRGIEMGKQIEGIRGLVIVSGEKIGFWGDIKVISFK